MNIAWISLLLRREVVFPVLLIGAGFWIWNSGYGAGYGAAERAVQARTDELSTALAERTEALSRAISEAEVARLEHQSTIESLEDEARNSTGAGRDALSADSVRRLRGRWAD